MAGAFAQLFLGHLREFLRDRMALFWTFAFVLFFALIFGLVVGQSWEPVRAVGVAAEGGGVIPRRLVEELKRLEAFDVLEVSRNEGEALWRAGRIEALIIVPQGVDEAVSLRRPASIAVRYDRGRRSSRTLVAVVEAALRRAEAPDGAASALLTLAPLNSGQQRLRPIDLFVPGVLTMLLMQLGLFGASMPMVSLRVQGVLRRLRATPLPGVVMLAAPIAVRLVIVALQMVVICLIAWGVFGVRMAGGSGVQAAAMAVLGAAAFIAIGLLIAGIARTLESANVLASALQVPMVFLSGILFPIDAAPAFLRPVMSVWPSTHLGDALGQLMIGAPAAYGLGVNAAVLTAWLVIAGGLAVRTLSLD